jgi:hypothetical protein
MNATYSLHIALSLVALAVSVEAQGVRTIDRGTFTITVNGTRAGREDFTIRSTPVANGIEHLSSATVVFGDRRLSPSLFSDSLGRPSRYEIKVQGTSGSIERWMGGITRGRVTARMEGARGMQEREYVVAEGAILVDDDVFHQYYFVIQRAAKGTIAIVIPRRNSQMVLRASEPRPAKVTIGQVELDARHFVLTEPSGETREVWVDALGRVLRVAIPSKGVIALRDDPPVD